MELDDDSVSQQATSNPWFESSQPSQTDGSQFDDDEYPSIYRGPNESTWRKRNADEIQLAKSLDQLRAQDLRVHLYNASRLKQLGVRHTNRKGEDIIWRPPKHWTAWPLPPDRVPREKGYEPGATVLRLPEPYINVPVKPSLLLEDVLSAVMLRKAGEQLRERQQRRQTHEIDSLPNQTIAATISRGARSRSPSESSTDSTTSSAVSHPSQSPKAPPAQPSLGQHASASWRSAKADSDQGSQQAANLEMLSDDDVAHDLLKPQIRHLISQLDTLLNGLHTARRSYADVHPQGESSTSESSNHSQSRDRRMRSGTPAPSTLRRTPSHEGEDENNEPPTQKRKRNFSSRRERSRKRQQKLGLREWGDVLGVALLTGFESDVVKRAGERCERLFTHDDRGSRGWRMLLPIPSPPNGGQGGGVDGDDYLQPIKWKRSRSWERRRRKKSKAEESE